MCQYHAGCPCHGKSLPFWKWHNFSRASWVVWIVRAFVFWMRDNLLMSTWWLVSTQATVVCVPKARGKNSVGVGIPVLSISRCWYLSWSYFVAMELCFKDSSLYFWWTKMLCWFFQQINLFCSRFTSKVSVFVTSTPFRSFWQHLGGIWFWHWLECIQYPQRL